MKSSSAEIAANGYVLSINVTKTILQELPLLEAEIMNGMNA